MNNVTASPHRSDLGARVMSGAAMLAVALAAIWIGGLAFGVLVAAASMLMLVEWAALVRAERRALIFALVGLAVVLLAGLAQMGDRPWTTVALALGVVIVTGVAMRNAELAGGVAYAGLPALALLAIRADPDIGFGLTLWTMAVVWATDIGAYFSGRRFGGLKLAPKISPGKTWAGLLGGMLAAGLVGAALAIYLVPARNACFWLGFPLAVAAQLGDLFESWLKRRVGVKDSGHWIPGHGGVLDRLDGLVPVVLLVALMLAIGAL
jgi:phosphatidate cytidylyltransferase